MRTARTARTARTNRVGAAKLALAERDDVTSALLDIRLRDGTGLDLYGWIGVHRPALAPRVAFVTGSASAEALEPRAAIGCPVLTRPFEMDELRRLVAEWETVADAGER